MCTILVKPAFTKFPAAIRSYMENAALRNGADKDGMGIMYKDVASNHISYWRSIDTYSIWDLRSIVEELEKKVKKYPEQWFNYYDFYSE